MLIGEFLKFVQIKYYFGPKNFKPLGLGQKIFFRPEKNPGFFLHINEWLPAQGAKIKNFSFKMSHPISGAIFSPNRLIVTDSSFPRTSRIYYRTNFYISINFYNQLSSKARWQFYQNLFFFLRWIGKHR